MRVNQIEIPYSGKTGGIVYLDKRQYKINNNLSEPEKKEVETMALIYLEFFSDHNIKIDHESVVFFTAYTLIPDSEKDLIKKSKPEDIARKFGVTKDLACFRKGLEKTLEKEINPDFN